MAEEITLRSLNKQYGANCLDVLLSNSSRCLEEIPGQAKGHRKFRVLSPLPSKEEYQKLHTSRYTFEVEGLVGDATSIVEELADEMQSWFDNLTDNLQQTDRGQRVGEAADALSSIYIPDLPIDTMEMSVVFVPGKGTSRADRAAEAADMLITAANEIESCLKSNVVNPEDRDQLEELVGEYQSIADELQSIDFPGMYG